MSYILRPGLLYTLEWLLPRKARTIYGTSRSKDHWSPYIFRGDVFRGAGADPVIIYHEKPVPFEYELLHLRELYFIYFTEIKHFRVMMLCAIRGCLTNLTKHNMLLGYSL